MDLAVARYNLIRPLLKRYARRFTVLDFGAGINPYMAQRISREFNCVIVAIEQNEIAAYELEQFGPRALWLRKKMSAEDIELLADCEHFDVVLALNILHHFDHWERVLYSIMDMCDLLIVQTPRPEDAGSCGQKFIPHIAKFMENYTPVGESVQFEGHLPRPIYCVEPIGESVLTRSSWTAPACCIRAIVHSGEEEKEIELAHKKLPRRQFIHGLNLWNFAQLNGQWPRKDKVLKMIREFPLPTERHGDITPHNFLLDGEKLHLIDGYEGWEFDDRENLLKTERMMSEALQ